MPQKIHFESNSQLDALNGRKNMRLHGYDYSRPGLYFLTIVVQNRLHLFGKIRQDDHAGPAKMFLNDAGNMIEQWYHEIENKFPDTPLPSRHRPFPIRHSITNAIITITLFVMTGHIKKYRHTPSITR